MSERDRQNPYDRDTQFGSGNRGSSGQASQWQGDSYRQQGGDWQQDGQRGGSDDYTRDYRFSGQGSSHDEGQGYGRGDAQDYGRDRGQRSFGSTNRSELNDDSLRHDQRDASRNYNQARGGYGQHNDRGQQDWQRSGSQDSYGQRSSASGYVGRDYDASGGNDFGNFTSEDFGGRDFSNRNGSAMGGMRSSESYRPSYGLSSWLRGNDDRDGRIGRSDDNRGGSNREDYGSWRQYGESRGFLQRAGDEVASWFGDEDASRRREQDHRQDQRSGQSQAQSHRGRGPSSYTRSDDRIREDANDHLTHDHHVDATHINVSVRDGELTLDGTVDSREAKRRAEDAVEHISGVKHVQNNLRVKDRATSSAGSGYTGGGAIGTGSSFGHSSGATGQASSSSLGSSSTTGGTSATSSGVGGSSTTASGQSVGTTGASTTSGVGSTATAGAGTASAPRASDKPS